MNNNYPPDGLEDLCCLYYEVHSRFYMNAMAEVGRLANAAGYTLNDVACLVTYAG